MRRRTLLAWTAAGTAASAVCGAGPSVAAGATLIEAVRARLTDAPVLRGEFEQRKSVRGFRNPLVSRGDFMVARGKGVIWRTREPFASSLTLTRDRLVARSSDGTVNRTIDAREEPAARLLTELMLALMAADLAGMSGRFRVEGELLGDLGWRLELTPADDVIRRTVSRVRMEGERHLRMLQIQETQGDSSEIRFNRIRAEQIPSPDEDAQLAR